VEKLKSGTARFWQSGLGSRISDDRVFDAPNASMLFLLTPPLFKFKEAAIVLICNSFFRDRSV